MIGSEKALNVYLGEHVIAKLTFFNDELHWQYNSSFQQSGYAVSPHLQLHGNIPPVNVQRFLRNLLPEGNGLDELINNFRLSKYNTFGLIQTLGRDTSGALIFLPTEHSYQQETSFRLITHDELKARLDHRELSSLIIWDRKPRLSVAGVQDKINVMLNTKGEMGFGEGRLCSTHI